VSDEDEPPIVNVGRDPVGVDEVSAPPSEDVGLNGRSEVLTGTLAEVPIELLKACSSQSQKQEAQATAICAYAQSLATSETKSHRTFQQVSFMSLVHNLARNLPKL
jgi:hypothetical protein